MLRVFISSTSQDLRAHRKAVRAAVRQLGMRPVMLEHAPAMNAKAVAACQKKVQSCDLFLGIYAKRYGYIPAGSGQSITELEYAWAKAAALPQHIFVVQPGYEWPHELSDMGDEYTKLEAFRASVGAQHGWSEFTDPPSLAAAVTHALAQDTNRVSRKVARQRRRIMIFIGLIVLAILGVIGVMMLADLDTEPIGLAPTDRAASDEALVLRATFLNANHRHMG